MRGYDSMKTKLFYFFSVLFLFTITSCKDSGTNPVLVIRPERLTGMWEYTTFDPAANTLLYKRVVKYDSTSEGYIFAGDGTLQRYYYEGEWTRRFRILHGSWKMYSVSSILCKLTELNWTFHIDIVSVTDSLLIINADYVTFNPRPAQQHYRNDQP